MGYRCHHAIIVTGTYEDWIDKAHAQASRIFDCVSSILETNQCRSFFIPPDGEEHHTKSHEGDNRREEFIEWLKTQRYQDRSSPLAWVEVQYGDQKTDDTMVCRHSEDEA